MYELIISHNGVETSIFVDADERMVELRRQRHARALTDGEATIREFKAPKKAKKK